ncbi:SMI1/KNR4 family protein [Streptomyces sp. NPDC006654]|uniref:SMI1/KNR4 family protein n=1 Tax=Streptomyces sp. NPDC006654 TaxID=3156897 RepID=UPI0033E1A0D1
MTDEEIVVAIRGLAASKGLPPAASPEAVAEAERVIGYSLPPLLRRLYLEVANGGFGPRGGILGVPGGEWRGDWADITDAYQAFSSAPDNSVPSGLIWLFEWGDAIWSLVDCRDPSGSMWGWDPNDGLEDALFSTGQTLSEWLADAIAGRDAIPQK